MLLLDRGDLGVQLACHRVRVHRADVHVEVVRLLLGRHDGERVQLGERRGLAPVVGLAQVVDRRAMLVDRRPPGQDVGVALQDVVRVLALEPVEQRGVAVHVVEVLEQAEAVDLREVLVGLPLRHRRRHVDRHLLVGDGGLEGRVVGADQPVDQRRLVVLHAPDVGKRPLQRLVHARAGVREAHRLVLDAVHEDDAHAGIRVVVELADRLLDEVAPGELLPLERDAAVIENARFHGPSG
jgi:hypothetical protein